MDSKDELSSPSLDQPPQPAAELTPQQQAAIAEKDLLLQCRMYENTLPEQDTCVMVNIRQITDVGTYVQLLEYNNIEGKLVMKCNWRKYFWYRVTFRCWKRIKCNFALEAMLEFMNSTIHWKIIVISPG